jgi:cyanophycinase
MGKIILIGGKVDIGAAVSKKKPKASGLKNIHPLILERFLKEMKGTKSRIEIITAATRKHRTVTGKEYKLALERLHCKNTDVMYFEKPDEADTKEFLERLKNCDGVIFTGGDQVLLCRALLGSKFLEILKKRFKKEKDFLISGTSAGAMAMPEIMIARGQPSEALRKGHVKLQKGLGLLPEIIVDTHFITRQRFGRLIEAVSTFPQKLGIGLCEDTAVFFKKPNRVETIGSNLVVLLDASRMSFNNLTKIGLNELICIEDMKLHVLPKGHKFNIPKRRIYKKLYKLI